jgi:hypothetical protein
MHQLCALFGKLPAWTCPRNCVTPAVMIGSVLWAGTLPRVDVESAGAVSAVVAGSYLLYAAQWYGPKFFPASMYDVQTMLFALFVVVQKIAWAPAVHQLTNFKLDKAWARVMACPTEVQALAAVLLVVGQVLNVYVYKTLGYDGVYYGHRYGKKVPWVEGFPFWINSPQYLGMTLTVLAVCLVTTVWSPTAKKGDNSHVLGLLLGNCIAHLAIQVMEDAGEKRKVKKA